MAGKLIVFMILAIWDGTGLCKQGERPYSLGPSRSAHRPQWLDWKTCDFRACGSRMVEKLLESYLFSWFLCFGTARGFANRVNSLILWVCCQSAQSIASKDWIGKHVILEPAGPGWWNNDREISRFLDLCVLGRHAALQTGWTSLYFGYVLYPISPPTSRIAINACVFKACGGRMMGKSMDMYMY